MSSGKIVSMNQDTSNSFINVNSSNPNINIIPSGNGDNPNGTGTGTRNKREMLKQFYAQQELDKLSGSPGGKGIESLDGYTSDQLSVSIAASGVGGGGHKEQRGNPKYPRTLTPVRIDPLDIDSPSYHPQLAASTLLSTLSLSNLLQNHNTIVNEIKDLDGNVKTLVYKNYSKFLVATDVILKMKSTAQEMDRQVAGVKDKMTLIDSRLTQITIALTPKKERITHLNEVDSLVKKLHFIIEMPRTLNDLIESKKYIPATLYTLRITSLLAPYSHRHFFHKTEKDVQELIKVLVTRVQDRVFSGLGSVGAVCEGIGMLVALGGNPSDLSKKCMYKAAEIIDKMMALQRNTAIDATTIEEFKKFNASFCSDLQTFSEHFSAFFVKRDDNDCESEIGVLKQKAFIAAAMGETEREVAGKALAGFVDEKSERYFQYVESQCLGAAGTSLQIIAVVTGHGFMADMKDKLGRLQRMVLLRLLGGVLGPPVGAVLTRVKMREEMNVWVKEQVVADMLPLLEEFRNVAGLSVQQVVTIVQEELVGFWEKMGNELSTNVEGVILLQAAKVASGWAGGVVESVFSMYVQRLAGDSPLEEQQKFAAQGPRMTLFFQSLGLKLMSQFARWQAGALTVQIRRYARAPLQDPPSPFAEIKMQLDRTALLLYETLNDKKTLKTTMHQSSTMQFDTMMDTLDKLFEERIVYIPPKLEMKTQVVMAAIAKALLKCLIEEVRQVNYTNEQCRWFESDLKVLAGEGWGEWGEEKVLRALIDRAITSALDNK